MVNDPIGDMITQIRNASMAGNREITLPYSRMKHHVANIIMNEGYLDSVEKIGEQPKLNLRIVLKYANNKSVITGLKRLSKPGMRIYIDKRSIPKVIGGLGFAILSTSQGIMTGQKARKDGIGGELLCEIW
jgi:small subunit ribosomal protein S8